MDDARRLLILADDFTGACDAAAGFARSRATLVVHGLPARWPSAADGIEVLGVDLDLRERSNADADAVTREVALQLCSAEPAAEVFLKIDSTLRGPIAGLMAGALMGSARQVAVIAPAFPEQGRLMRAGCVVVDGEPGASLTQALGMEGTALLGANFARSAEDIELAVEHARNRGARHVVVDADGIETLRSVAIAWRRHATEWLLVGSAGLARQVAGSANQPNRETLTPSQGPILVVAGSPAAATQAQIERLRGLGPSVLVGVGLPVPRRPAGLHEVIVVCTAPATERDSGENARAVAQAIGAWADAFQPGAVVLAGGATARLVCERLGAHGVRLQSELQPGIPHGLLRGGLWDGVRVVTKAGGFGTPETLLDVVQALGVSSVAERTHD